ncbi:MAG: glycosyltransferase family 4 protein [Burkholderiales bacterium]|nr:glycosyltransferase family 4 protein [Burkholderiales bacterium]
MSARPAAALHVGVSLGKSSPGDGGLFEFSSQLAQRIVRVAPEWQARWGVQFSFHVRPELQGCFGPTVHYLPLAPVQRLIHLAGRRFALWHSTHQLTKYKPPQASAARLLTVHDLNYLYGRNAWSTWRNQRRMARLLHRFDHLTAVSHYTAADVRSHLGWKGPLEVIHNGARSLVGAPQAPLPGVDASRPFLLHLSRMSASKNPQALVALARVWPEMQFVLCGAPSDSAKALQASNTLPNLQFHLGISDEQKTWAYAHCAGFLFPSLTEGFGLPPIEAMHFGKPVFLARRTCLPEIGGDAAFYFDEFEPQSMRRIVEAGLQAGAAPGAAERVRAHAAQFDWDRCAGQYLALYRRLLGLPAG